MVNRPRILDLFSGAGGSAVGYHRAGFDVVGVDINPQPNYPFEFVQADALSILRGMRDYPTFSGEMWRPGYFAAIHASPPCTDHTELWSAHREGGTGWMLAATLDLIQEIGLPYVVENVPGAPMPGAFTLCGRSLGLGALRRHRRFVSSHFMLVPPCGCAGQPTPIGVYGDLRANDRAVTRNQSGRVWMRAGIETARDLMGCPWMTGPELSQAIPPAYTELIGTQLLASLAVPA